MRSNPGRLTVDGASSRRCHRAADPVDAGRETLDSAWSSTSTTLSGVDRLLVALVLAAVALAVAMLLQRRRVDPPTQPSSWEAPAQLDRSDFDRPETPWLVCVFTSSNCSTCSEVLTKAAVLASADVVVQEVEATEDRDLHQRYGIEAVPIVAVADADGVVRKSFVGPVNSTHLWAAVAELREPGALPGESGRRSDP